MLADLLALVIGTVLKVIVAIFEWTREAVEWTYEQAQLFWLWWKGIVLEVYLEIMPWLLNQLPPDFVERLNEIPWDQVVSAWSDLAWIIPLEETLTIIGATFGIAASIRLLRYIIGWFPILEG